MLRCTIEILPFGDESTKRTLGVVEIAQQQRREDGLYDYKVILRKTPPYDGALRHVWRSIRYQIVPKDESIIVGDVDGFHRTKRGVYDLLFRALRAVVGHRNPEGDGECEKLAKAFARATNTRVGSKKYMEKLDELSK